MPGFTDFIEKKAKQIAHEAGNAAGYVANNPYALAPNPLSIASILPDVMRGGAQAGVNLGIPGASQVQRATAPAINLASVTPAFTNRIGSAATPAGFQQADRDNSLDPILQSVMGIPGAVENLGSAFGQGVNNALDAAAPRTWVPNVARAGAEMARNPGMDNALGFAEAMAAPSLALANTPVEAVHTEQGEGAAYVASHAGQMRDVDASSPFNYAVVWAQEHPEEWPAIQQAYTQGYGNFGPGPRAVWEYYIGKQSRSQRFQADVTNDPWNLLLLTGAAEGALGKAGTAVGERSATLGQLINDLGTVVGKTEGGLQKAMDLPYSIPLKTARAGVRQIPGEANAERWLANNIFKESTTSVARRRSDQAATAVSDLGTTPTSMQEVPAWAIPQEATGNYELIQPGDPRTSGGQAYVVDPNGNPIAGYALTGKGGAKKLRKAVTKFNAGGENLPMGQGVSIVTQPVGDQGTPADWVAPQTTATRIDGVGGLDDGGVFPSTAPTGPLTINNTVVKPGEAGLTQPFPTTGPSTEEGLSQGWVNGNPRPQEGPPDGTTPFDFQQTPGQRQTYINNGATAMAPNIRPGDQRISTLVEQARATQPAEAAAFEAKVGFDRATGGAIPGTPYGDLQADLADLPRWYEAEDGGLAGRAVDERLLHSGYTVRQQAPIYEQTFGTRMRPDVPVNSQGSIEEMVGRLHSEKQGEQANGAAQLIGRFIFGTDADAILVNNALFDYAKDHPWIDTRLAEANAIRQDMRQRWDMNTPQRTVPPAPVEPTSVQQNMAGTRTDDLDLTFPMPENVGLMDPRHRGPAPQSQPAAPPQVAPVEPITPYGQFIADTAPPPAGPSLANQRRNPRSFAPIDREVDNAMGPDLPEDGPLSYSREPEPDVTPDAEPPAAVAPDVADELDFPVPGSVPEAVAEPDGFAGIKRKTYVKPPDHPFESGATLTTDDRGKRVYVAPDGREYRIAQSPGSKSATVHGAGGDVIEKVKGTPEEVAMAMDGFYDPKWDKGASAKMMKRDLADGFTARANKGAKTSEPVWWIEDRAGNVIDDHRTLFGAESRAAKGKYQHGEPPLEEPPTAPAPQGPSNPPAPAPAAAEPNPIQQAAPNVGDEASPTISAEPPESAVATSILSGKKGDIGMTYVPTRSISTDPARFQPRGGVAPERVQNIVESYDPQAMDPLKVWQDPSDGKVYVLAGHHRLEALREMGVEDAPVIEFRGTEEQAINAAQTSNNQAAQSPLEQAGVARRLRGQGMSIKKIRQSMNLTSDAQAQKYVYASYAPQTVKEHMKVPVDQGGASLNLVSAMGAPVAEGTASVEEMAQLFDFFVKRDGKLPTADQIEQFMSVAEIRRAAIERGEIDPTAPVKAQSLFDMTGLTTGGPVSDVIRQIEEMGKVKKDLEIQRGALVSAKNKSGRTAVDVQGADRAIAETEKKLEALQEQAANFSVRNAFGAAPEPPKVVDTALGKQYEMPGTPPPELTLNTQEIPTDAPPELTPEQIRQQQIDAGQGSLFAVNPSVKWAGDRVDNALDRPRALPAPDMPDTDALLDQLVRDAVVDTSQAAVLREVFPGMQNTLFTEYADKLRQGFTPDEAKTALRKQVYAAIAPEKQLSKVRWRRLLQQSWKVIQSVNAAARQNMMYNIVNLLPGSFGDMAGNNMHLYQTANYGAIKDSSRVAALAFQGGEESIANAFSVPHDPVLAGWGRNQPEHIIPRSSQGVMNNQGFADENLKIWEWARTLSKKGGRDEIPGFLKPILGTIASPKARSIRQGLDAGNKSALFDQVLDDNLDQFVDNFMVNLQDAGIPAQETINAIRDRATELRAPAGFKGQLRSFSPQDVIDVTGNKRLGQIWAETRNQAYSQAADEVRKVYFAGAKRYVLDDALSQVFFFHFWQSRALALQGRSMLRNPRIMGQYYRMIQGAMHEADENGYPPTFRGLTHYWGDTTAGWYGLFNPLGVIVPAMMFGDLANSRKDAGGWEKISSILPVTPMFQAAVSALGLSDQTPYVMGTARVQNIVADVMSWGNAHGFNFAEGLTGPGVVDDPVQAMTRKVLGGINWMVAKAGGKEFHPYISKNGKTDTIRAVVLQLAQDKYGPMEQWTPEQIADVQDAVMAVDVGGKGNPLADEAFISWADANMRNRLAGAVLPQGSVLRYGPREGDRNLAASGVDTPQVRSAQTRNALRSGTEDSIPLTMGIYEKNQIGGLFEKQLNQAYSDIRYGTPKGDGTDPTYQIMGQTVTMTQLAALPDEDRKLAAAAYVDQQGGTAALQAYWDQTRAFEAANPSLASYDSYTTTVNQYPGGAGAFRQWARDISPEFKRREAVQRARIRATGVTGAALEAEMDGWARGQDAYLAFRAKKKNIYDQNPVGGQPNGDAVTTLQTMQLIQQLQQGNGQNTSPQNSPYHPPAPTAGGWVSGFTIPR